MTDGLALAQAAKDFVGCTFRANGRDPGHGLDCVGLLEASLHSIGRSCVLPSGYRLRTAKWAGLEDWAARLGFRNAVGPCKPGDVLLFQPSALQLHFAIVDEAGAALIEAHAGLRRVVVTPAPYPHPEIGRWRLPSRN